MLIGLLFVQEQGCKLFSLLLQVLGSGIDPDSVMV